MKSFVFFALLVSVLVTAHSEELVEGSTTGDFDFLLFTQGWPGTNCQVKTCLKNQTAAAADGFLIHGLWPNNDDGSYPSFCGGSFDVKSLDDLMTDLDEYWPSLYESPMSGFWEHEWMKHGTCCSPGTFDDEHDYFASILKLREKMDLYAVLEKTGISAGWDKTYKLSDIGDAVAQTVGHYPVFECYKDNNSLYLWEIWLCFDKDLSIMDCGDTFVSKQLARSKCGSFETAEVVIPPIPGQSNEAHETSPLLRGNDN